MIEFIGWILTVATGAYAAGIRIGMLICGRKNG